MRPPIPTYKPSGSLNISVFLYFLLALFAGILVSWFYQWLVSIIPFIYINVVITIVFGVALGGLGYLAFKYGHSRNQTLNLVLGVPLALLPLATTYYWQYLRLITDVAEAEEMGVSPDVGVATFIKDFPEYANLRKEAGWSISKGSSASGRTINGNFVYVVWGIEALIVTGGTLLIISGVTRTPYCEGCKRWCDAEKKQDWPGISAQEVNTYLEKGDLEGVRNLPSSGIEQNRVMKVSCNYCNHCQTSGFLSLTEEWTYAKTSKGEDKTRTTELLHNAILSPDQRIKWINRLGGQETSSALPPSLTSTT